MRLEKDICVFEDTARCVGGNEGKARTFAEAVCFIVRADAQWCKLPIYYGKWMSVHKRFKQWSHKGLWNQILTQLNAPECLDRSKGESTTKVHIVLGALGQARKFSLTPG